MREQEEIEVSVEARVDPEPDRAVPRADVARVSITLATRRGEGAP
jgi:hypothetical protein